MILPPFQMPGHVGWLFQGGGLPIGLPPIFLSRGTSLVWRSRGCTYEARQSHRRMLKIPVGVQIVQQEPELDGWHTVTDDNVFTVFILLA